MKSGYRNAALKCFKSILDFKILSKLGVSHCHPDRSKTDQTVVENPWNKNFIFWTSSADLMHCWAL